MKHYCATVQESVLLGFPEGSLVWTRTGPGRVCFVDKHIRRIKLHDGNVIVASVNDLYNSYITVVTHV